MEFHWGWPRVTGASCVAAAGHQGANQAVGDDVSHQQVANRIGMVMVPVARKEGAGVGKGRPHCVSIRCCWQLIMLYDWSLHARHRPEAVAPAKGLLDTCRSSIKSALTAHSGTSHDDGTGLIATMARVGVARAQRIRCCLCAAYTCMPDSVQVLVGRVHVVRTPHASRHHRLQRCFHDE